MAIIAAAICSRAGQIQCARTYLPITFGRLETLISSFPRLLESGQQHRYVERKGSALRYLFQSIDDFYVVVLTNRSSNVISDLRAVSQLASAATDILKSHTGPSREVDFSQAACFQLLLAFDEIATELGIAIFTKDALQEVLAMESQEEAVQEAILQTKAKEAKEAAKQKIKQLEMAKKEALRASTYRSSRSNSSATTPTEPWSAPLVPSVNIQEERAAASQNRSAAVSASTKIRAMKLR